MPKIGRRTLITVLPFALACVPQQPAREGAAKGPRAGVGDMAPELEAEYIMGEGPRTLAEARGKITILDFWATFCDPCRRSFPAYQELHGDVAIVAVALDDPDDVTVEAIKAFAQETGATFTILWDKTQVSRSLFKIPKMPTAYVIDDTGRLRHFHGGYRAATMNEVRAEVDALRSEMAERQPEAP